MLDAGIGEKKVINYIEPCGLQVILNVWL